MTNGSGTDILKKIILCRLLLPSKRPPTVKQVEKDLHPFFEEAWTPAEWRERFDAAAGDLRQEGKLESERLVSTEAGKAEALAFLGLEELPANMKWTGLRDKFLLAKALDLDPTSEEAKKATKGLPDLRARLLAREYGLKLAGSPTMARVMDALVYKQAGIETDEKLTLAKIKTLLLRKLAPDARTMAPGKLAEMLAAASVGATSNTPAALRLGALRRWAARKESPGVPFNGPMSEVQFLDFVRKAAIGCAEGRHGEDRVFIEPAWRWLQSHIPESKMSLEEFKNRLVQAQRRGDVRLSRLDLVNEQNERVAKVSEIAHEHSTFHLLQTPGPSP